MRKAIVLLLTAFFITACAYDDDHHGGGYYGDRDDYGYGSYYPYGRADYPRDRIWIVDGHHGCRYYSYQGYCYRYKDDYYRAMDWDRKRGYDDNWHKRRKAWCNKHDCRREHDNRYDNGRDGQRESETRHYRQEDYRDNPRKDRGDHHDRDDDRKHDNDRGNHDGRSNSGWWNRDQQRAAPVERDGQQRAEPRGRAEEQYRPPVERDSGVVRQRDSGLDQRAPVEHQERSQQQNRNQQRSEQPAKRQPTTTVDEPQRQHKGKHNRGVTESVE